MSSDNFLKTIWRCFLFVEGVTNSDYHLLFTKIKISQHKRYQWGLMLFLVWRRSDQFLLPFIIFKNQNHNTSTTNEVWCCSLCSSRSDQAQPSWTHPRKPGWEKSQNNFVFYILYFIFGEVSKYKRNTFIAGWIYTTFSRWY